MNDEFVHLHTHTEHSRYDGLGSPAVFAQRAAELGQGAIAFTEHGTINGFVAQAKACKKAGIKHIPGVEAYLCDDTSQRGLTAEEKAWIKATWPDDWAAKTKEFAAARRERDHITLWAYNQTGYRNLCKLTSYSWRDDGGYYFKPRMDMKLLAQYSEGIMASTGCPGGVIPSQIAKGDLAEARRRMEALAAIYGDKFLVEIMPHKLARAPQIQATLLDLAREYGLRPIATQDAHYPYQRDAHSHEVFLCVQTQGDMQDPDKVQFDSFEYYLKSRAEMAEAFDVFCPEIDRATVQSILDNTMHVADLVTAQVTFAGPGTHLAAPKLPPGVPDYDTWVKKLIVEGVRWRHRCGINELSQEYRDRIRMEFDRISHSGFSAYFILVWDIKREARTRGIFAGPGRGSGGGSSVAYYLGITDLDPLEYDLSFDRFLAPGRVDLPDFDLDFASSRRDELFAYLQDRYGHDHVASISTHSRMQGKMTLQRVGRAYGVPAGETAGASALIVDAIEAEVRAKQSLVTSLEASAIGREFMRRYPQVIEAAAAIEGNIFTAGRHPAGIVIGPRPLDELIPLESRKADDKTTKAARRRMTVTAFDMAELEELGFVKIDALSLTALDVVGYATETIRARLDPTFDLLLVDRDDAATLQAFTDHRFAGVFQYDTPSSRTLCRNYTFRSLDDVAVITALNRPGPLKSENGSPSMAAIFVQRSIDPETIEASNPVYDQITSKTLGVIVYQEQVVELARRYAGYTAEEADQFRRKIGKKKGLSDEIAHFIEGAVAGGHGRNEATILVDRISGFAKYAFNKSHSYAYGLFAYQNMWLKVHFPAVFYAAFLSKAKKETDRIRLAAEAVKIGSPILAPDVNLSGNDYVVVGGDGLRTGQIVSKIDSIMHVGAGLARAIVAERERGGPYRSLEDFYARLKAQPFAFNVRNFRSLARATCLRSICPNTKWLVENADSIWKSLGKGLEVGVGRDRDYSREELVRVASAVFPMFAAEGVNLYQLTHRNLLRLTRSLTIEVPETAPKEGPATAFVFGRVNVVKMYADTGEAKSMRLSLIGEDGDEIVARADQDVLDTCPALVDSSGKCVLAALSFRPNGRAGIEAAWIVPENVATITDPVLEAVIGQRRLKLTRSLSALGEKYSAGDTGRVRGLVLRKTVNKSARTGKPYAKIVLASLTDFKTVMVFGDRLQRPDFKQVKYGHVIDVEVEIMEGGDLSLRPRAITSATVEPNTGGATPT